ncbi:hypothetical protein [Neobacillus sp. Marseille-QA0830]
MNIGSINELQQSCANILAKVNEKLIEVVNPLLIRIQYVVEEFQSHLLALTKASGDIGLQKYHWSVLYRAGDTMDEFAVLIHNTTPVPIKNEVDYIKQQLVFYANQVVQLYGKRESLYIITPKFQELAKIW